MALEKGFANLERHINNLRRYDVPVIVSINRFSTDRGELALLKRLCATIERRMRARRSLGARRRRRRRARPHRGAHHRDEAERFSPALSRRHEASDKARTIAQEIYGAPTSPPIRPCATVSPSWKRKASASCRSAWPDPISFSTNPDAKGAPPGFTIPIREVRLSAGAEFVVVICGDIMTMPGLPKGARRQQYRPRPGRADHRAILDLSKEVARGSRGRYHLPARRGSLKASPTSGGNVANVGNEKAGT